MRDMTDKKWIKEHCKVFAEADNAIMYEQCGMMYADINGKTYYCKDVEKFYELIASVDEYED